MQDVCRYNIRSYLRKNILIQIPQLQNVQRNRRQPKPKRHPRSGRSRRINIVPMSVGMMILGNFDESDEGEMYEDIDDISDLDSLNNRGTLISTNSEDDNDLNNKEDGNTSKENEDCVSDEADEKDGMDYNSSASRTRGIPVVKNARINLSNRKIETDELAEEEAEKVDADTNHPHSVPANNSTENKRASPSSMNETSQTDNTSKRMRCMKLQDSKEEEHTGNGFFVKMKRRTQDRQHDPSSEDSDLENMELDPLSHSPATPTAVLQALNLLTLPRKIRCSSSTSADTSETSGIGSYTEEPVEMAHSCEKDSPGIFMEEETGSVSQPTDSCPSETASGYNGPTLAALMKERINLLPLPLALRSYLAYHRN